MLEEKRKNKEKIFTFLLSQLSPFKSALIIVLFSIILVSSAILGLGFALKHIIDQGFVEHNLSNLNFAFLILVGFIFLLSIASYSRSIRVNSICDKIESNIKCLAYKNIINISPTYFEEHKISDIVSRLTTDLTILSNSILLISSYSLRNLMMGLGGLILLFFTSLKLTSLVILILPLAILPIIILGRKTKKLSKDNQNEIAITNARIDESLGFIKTVQAYNNQEFEYEKFLKQVDKTANIAKKRIRLRSLLFALVILLVLSSIVLVLWVGGHDVVKGVMSAGSLSSFIFYSILVATSIGSLSEVYSDWQRAIGALERILEVIEAKSTIFEEENAIESIENSDIKFEQVSYFYPSRKEIKVIDNVSFVVKEGETIALVGQSGSGKSTIFNLLLRFDDVKSGSINIAGLNIKDLKLKALRENFALVTQDPIIFSASAYDNIIYGKLTASYQEVIEAAKSAEIYDFLMTLPEGLNTYLGEKGVKLSGGQKQRIAIARAILANPKILLLDEATNSLDSENEKLVQIALSQLMKNRTTIIISHNIHSIINADNIIILDKGKIIAQGLHKELLSSCDLYKKLYNVRH